MKTKIDKFNKIVFFEGDFPSVMGIPSLMNRQFPDYSYRVLSPHNFKEVDLPLISPSKFREN